MAKGSLAELRVIGLDLISSNSNWRISWFLRVPRVFGSVLISGTDFPS